MCYSKLYANATIPIQVITWKPGFEGIHPIPVGLARVEFSVLVLIFTGVAYL